MNPPTVEPPSPFAEKFKALYELLSEFSRDAIQLRYRIKVNDDRTRAVLSSLSRITGFSDQLQMVMALMREDVRVVEELAAPADPLWPEQFEDSYRQWVQGGRMGSRTMS
jgi:hypothetical protein